ncbi:unnamed protein product [Aphanomyces euteiches]|uniref:Aldehyde dehydrogenase n=2 Tax=Aphanomyces euteiches TaxID=100861 RepID=A0A6G0WW69_9STRA|nr:hypothetical protein Ae201684_011028 [Aphanomyces euteiches]KAH9058504.1 hypothetical protein Ae201684P_005847 [Aphanomyces euteiches]KAH9145700.1 hypothetical protein AeRB84_010411 [Aphanomyces euteiches]
MASCVASDVAALRKTFNSEKTRPLVVRKEIIKQLRRLIVENEQELCQALQQDLHKHPAETYAFEMTTVLKEIQEHLDYLDDWAAPHSVATSIVCLPGMSSIVAEPLGVVLLFGTWNYPIYLSLLPLVGALSAGNCALVRFAADGSVDATNALLASLFDKYLDRDIVRYAIGGLDVSKEVLAQRYDLIFCTGSERIGKIVARAAAENLTPVVLELGGKSPTIIDDTADLTVTARRVAWGAFANAGQTCVRPDHVFVSEMIGDAFVQQLKHETERLFSADPVAVDHYGRIANDAHFDKLHLILKQDAKYIVHGGDVDRATRFIAPTILNFKSDRGAFDRSAAMADEIFGPIIPVVYSSDLSSILAAILSRPKPLGLYVFSRNQKTIDRILSRTSSGAACVNDTMMQMSNHNLPFGGVGSSGMGRYHGKFSFDTFSHAKAILRKPFWLDLPQRYMPYTPLNVKIVRLLLSPIPRAAVRGVLGTVILVAVVLLSVYLSKPRGVKHH